MTETVPTYNVVKTPIQSQETIVATGLSLAAANRLLEQLHQENVESDTYFDIRETVANPVAGQD